jgi:hypothetical protein
MCVVTLLIVMTSPQKQSERPSGRPSADLKAAPGVKEFTNLHRSE